MPIHALSGQASSSDDGSLVEGPSVHIDEPDGQLTVIEDAATHVVEIRGEDPMVVHIVEPVAVDPGALGLELDDLADVDGMDSAPMLTPLVLHKGTDGILRPISVPAIAHLHWGEEIRFGVGEPDAAAPPGATWVDYADGNIYRAEEIT